MTGASVRGWRSSPHPPEARIRSAGMPRSTISAESCCARRLERGALCSVLSLSSLLAYPSTRTIVGVAPGAVDLVSKACLNCVVSTGVIAVPRIGSPLMGAVSPGLGRSFSKYALR